jgi:hypothetical protein
MGGFKPQDFPPGLQGGLEHDDEDHRLGETGQTGPEAPGDINRGHPEQTGTENKATKDSAKNRAERPSLSRRTRAAALQGFLHGARRCP